MPISLKSSTILMKSSSNRKELSTRALRFGHHITPPFIGVMSMALEQVSDGSPIYER